MIKVFGHITPDTDATCSAIVYAWYLREHRQQDAQPFVLGPISREATYVLEHFALQVPALLELQAGDTVVIVDTNNPEELPETIQEAKIIGIVDHHKLFGGLSTAEPIPVVMQPLACTATVIWQEFQKAGIGSLPQEIAGIMLASILSDTLKFTSPTTTQFDRAAAEALTSVAGVNIETLAAGMFAAKSDLTGLSPKSILTSDSKIFTIGGKKLRVSSLETTNPAIALGMKHELLPAMEELKVEEQLDGLFFFVVDILQSSATLMVPSQFEREVAEKGFAQHFEGEVLELPGVVSRKKQIIPALEAALT